MKPLSKKSVSEKEDRKCDCILGMMSDSKVHKSTIFNDVFDLSRIQQVYSDHGVLKGIPLTPLQILDHRRGYLQRFAFCGYCGEKINWKEILSKIQELTDKLK